MKKKRSEGVRRIVAFFSLGLSLVWVVGWCSIIILIGKESGFKDVNWISLSLWTISITAVLYFTPRLIAKIIYWIIGGFQDDKEET